MEKPMPLYEVHGSHYQIGCQIGEAARSQVRHSLDTARNLLAEAFEELHLSWEMARILVLEHIASARAYYPQYVEEMQGIADGSRHSFEDIAVLNMLDTLMEYPPQFMHCTSLAVSPERSANGHVLVAHNEDWIPEDEQDFYLVRARPSDEPVFLGIGYGGTLPIIGLNGCGLASCCQTAYPGDAQAGVPPVILARATLAARSPGEAIKRLLVQPRTPGYNHLFAHESGELHCVEVSSQHFAILGASDGYTVHTNHYTDYLMRPLERNPAELIRSHMRYHRALRLLKLTPFHTIDSLKAILRDHLNMPHSICNHAMDGDPIEREKTVSSLIIDLTERRLHLAWGCPCETPYVVYELEE